MLALISGLVPETYHPVLLRQKAIKLRKDTGDNRWKAPIEIMQRSLPQTILRSCYRPFLLLTLEPMCLNLCLFSAILLGVLYLFFGAFEIVFAQNHHFVLWQIGLTFSGLLVGQVIAIMTDPLWHKNYIRLLENREKNGGEPGGSEPEYRLPPAIIGAFIVPIGLFWYVYTHDLIHRLQARLRKSRIIVKVSPAGLHSCKIKSKATAPGDSGQRLCFGHSIVLGYKIELLMPLSFLGWA